jgi:Phage integrase family
VAKRTGGRAAPTTVNSLVRTREYLTGREVERLMAAARKGSRWGHRDATMILIGYRHGLRASELCGLQWFERSFASYVDKYGLSHRLRFYPGDFFTDPLPAETRNFDRHAALRGADVDHGPEIAPRKPIRECLRREQAPCAHSVQEDVPRGRVVVQGRVASVAEDTLRRAPSSTSPRRTRLAG